MPGVYISYPFCGQKCTFCNFASGVSKADDIERYERALIGELQAHSWSWQPETVYLGGGSPNLMAGKTLEHVLRQIPAGAVSEVTMECAPGTLTPAQIESWQRAGVNRVSLGVQSFITAELRATGRRHTAEGVAREIDLLRAAGICDINIDLIAGLPWQTKASWRESLGWIHRLEPPHVSVYIFETDEDSRLGKELLLGGARYGAGRVPGDDAVADFYEEAVTILERCGIRRYEISNFARPGAESRHNLKYWQLAPYIGFGLDAHSYENGVRWANPDELEKYLAGERAGERVAGDAAEEHFFVGLRLASGIQPSAAEWARFREPIAKWTAAGLLERDGSRLKLASAGVLLSNEIFQEFLHA